MPSSEWRGGRGEGEEGGGEGWCGIRPFLQAIPIRVQEEELSVPVIADEFPDRFTINADALLNEHLKK